MNNTHEERVNELLKEMTLREKAGQLAMIEIHRLDRKLWNADEFPPEWLLSPVDPCEEGIENVIARYGVGALLSGGSSKIMEDHPEGWADFLNRLQESARKTRLGIPLFYGVDAVHGVSFLKGSAVYPHNLGIAAAFNPDIARAAGRQTAAELAALGMNWAFAPTVDVARDPRWGRTYETLSEDPFLASCIGSAMIEGLQESGEVMACAKHFIGYSNSNNGRDRAPADISERTLREVHLPAFRSAVKSGVGSVMFSSGETNGVPCHASHRLGTRLLREEMGFEGIAVSDWEDIQRLVWFHHVAPDFDSAVERAYLCGLDVYMATTDLGFIDRLVYLVEQGRVSQERLDEAVRRVLRAKFALGLFDRHICSPAIAKRDIGSFRSRELALQAAREGTVLLKNEDILPLTKQVKSILVAGSAADSRAVFCGGWTIQWQGALESELEGVKTLSEALQERLPDTKIIRVNESDAPETIREAAASASLAVVAISEPSHAEGHGDLPDLEISYSQKEMIKLIAQCDIPVILTGIVGRALILKEIEPLTRAILWSFLPGTEGASAIADILVGCYNPCGRLPLSFPREVGQLPVFYNGRGNALYDPLYPFGFGLSYTRFEYTGLEIHGTRIAGLECSVLIKNTGKMPGEETVLLFTSADISPVVRPAKELKAFGKLHLAPGEEKRVTLSVSSSDLRYLNEELIEVEECGTLKILVGPLEGEVKLF